MSTQYLKEQEIFDEAAKQAEGMTQKEIAEQLDCTQASVSKMLNGQSRMLSLAIRWLDVVEIETDDGKPVRYYKAVSEN